jgi:hypothetical protein
MEWLKGIAALALVVGVIGFAFWKGRGVPPSGKPPGPDGNSYDSTSHSN